MCKGNPLRYDVIIVTSRHKPFICSLKYRCHSNATSLVAVTTVGHMGYVLSVTSYQNDVTARAMPFTSSTIPGA